MQNTRVRILGGAALVLAMAGCGMAPMAPPRVVGPVATAPIAQPPVLDGGAAERACIAAGQERGLNVLGVAGARDITGPNGEMMRDVMLRVSRGGAQIEVRCNYQSAQDLARIMLI
jgi:hypothetical protein